MMHHKKNESSGISRHPFKKESRRSFLKKASAATITLAGSNMILYPGHYQPGNSMDDPEIPWYKRCTRWGQTNITEIDPSRYDISWWRKYWNRTQIQGIIVNAGGIIAYYPSKIPLHHHAEFLKGRDLFGELCNAAHEDGLAVFARMDSNRAHEELYKVHPDWFAMDASGRPYRAGDLYITCVNSPYYDEHIPSILTEIASAYHPEGFTDNSWSGLGRESVCYCDNCRKRFRERTGLDIPKNKNWDDKTYREWIRWNYARRLEIWDLNNRTTKTAGGRFCIWAGMNSGSISGQCRSFRDYPEICRRADIIMLDSQARNDSDGFQQNGGTGKLIHGLLGWDKLIPESMAMYQAGRPAFRLAAKPEPEARMWIVEGFAGGIQPWWHHVGAYHEDRRMYHTAEPLFLWHKKNQQYLTGRKPVATVGIVWSRQNMDFYGRDNSDIMVDLPWRGITNALIRARIPFLPLHADHVERDASLFSLLILPDFAVITDNQVSSLKKFILSGGNLIATGHSCLFNEWGDPRPDYALADVFGAHVVRPFSDYNDFYSRFRKSETFHTYLRLSPELRKRTEGPITGTEPAITEERHSVLKGFDETDIMAFGGLLESLRTDTGAKILMTFIPEFPIYPPETAWMRIPKTDIPGLIINSGPANNRIVFLPADIDRQYGRYNLPDHGNLLSNLVRWTVQDNIPLIVDGKGLLDCYLYQQNESLILHIVNLTSSGTWRQPVDELMTTGPFRVQIKLPDLSGHKSVKLLVADRTIDSSIKDGWISFVIGAITDHEVVLIT